MSFLVWVARIGLAITILAGAIWGWSSIRKMKDSNVGLRDSFVCSLKKKGQLLIPFVCVTLIVVVLVPIAGIDGKISVAVNKILDILLILLAGWAGTMIVSLVSEMAQCRYDINVKDNLAARQVHTKVKVLQRIVVVLIWLLTIAGILMLFDQFRMLGSTLLASAGVVSIVLGFSAQKTFGAMVAGLQIALSHPINLDDVVIVEGEWGRIEEITFTYVVVKTWDLRRIVVPMTYFLETPFQNWTKKNADIIGSIFIHVDYTCPLGPLREELNRLCIKSKPLWDGKTCVLQVTDAGPETLTLRAIVSSPDASSAWDLRCQLREALVEFLRMHYPESLPKHRVSVQSGLDVVTE
ncbi:mechanosensitive ion channel family protein [Pseudodesulfovibrio nedwellii]|nr:mechanosensitive ion channel domain-containing protein [Pseudodesulfovibrio nedwellii]